LIILGKKFDIRQWVVVTSWEPLKVWLYDECYLRFTSENYDPQKLHDKFMHLTNNSIAKYSENFDKSTIEGNMWSCEEFRNYLLKEYPTNAEDIFNDRIIP
jgi:tubulin monoglycylase TTLL3/8